MVSVACWFSCLLAAFATLGCATPKSNPWVAGVEPHDADEIGAMIRARTSGDIAVYTRELNGDVAVWMRPGHDPKFGDIGRVGAPLHAYVVRRIRGKWQIVGKHVILL